MTPELRPPDEDIEALIVKLERLTIRRKDGRATPAPRVVYEGAAALRSLSARNRVMREAAEELRQACGERDDGPRTASEQLRVADRYTAALDALRTALSEQTTKP